MKSSLLLQILLTFEITSFVNGLTVTDVKYKNSTNSGLTNLIGEVQLTIAGVDYFICAQNNTFLYSTLSTLICNALGLTAGTVLGQISTSTGPFVGVNPRCVFNCTTVDLGSCIDLTITTCASGSVLNAICNRYITHAKNFTGPCAEVNDPKAVVSNIGTSGVLAQTTYYELCTEPSNAELFGILLCSYMGYSGFYSVSQFGAIIGTHVAKLNASCLTPCHNTSISECIAFIPECNLNTIIYARCFDPKTKNDKVDTCLIFNELNKTVNEVWNSGTMRFYDAMWTTNMAILGTLGWLYSESINYPLCFNGTYFEAFVFGKMACPAVGLSPSYGGALAIDSSVFGAPKSLIIDPSCLNSCGGKQITLRSCTTSVGRCRTGYLLASVCGQNQISKDLSGFLCPDFNKGNIVLVNNVAHLQMGNSSWTLCFGSTNNALNLEFSKRVCLKLGYPGVDRIFDAQEIYTTDIAGVKTDCLNNPQASPESCVSLPATCPIRKFVGIMCTGASIDNGIAEPTFFDEMLQGDGVMLTLSGQIIYNNMAVTDDSGLRDVTSSNYKLYKYLVCQLVNAVASNIKRTIRVCYVDNFSNNPVNAKVSFVVAQPNSTASDRDLVVKMFVLAYNAYLLSVPTFYLKNIDISGEYPIQSANIILVSSDKQIQEISWSDTTTTCSLNYVLVYKDVNNPKQILAHNAGCNKRFIVGNLKPDTEYQYAISTNPSSNSIVKLYSFWSIPYKTKSRDTLSNGSIIGIIIGVILSILLILVILFCVLYFCVSSFKACVNRVFCCCCGLPVTIAKLKNEDVTLSELGNSNENVYERTEY